MKDKKTGERTRIICVGANEAYNGRSMNVYCNIRFSEDGRLSITGVEGPNVHGNCAGGCGQITESVRGIETLATEWTPEMITKFCDIWDQWHLNDMRAGCEHQRAEKWGKEKITVTTYATTMETYERQDKIKAEAMKKLKAGYIIPALSEIERVLLLLESQIKDRKYALLPEELKACYKVEKTEEQYTTWVREEEHEKGALSKVCAVCGYAYGHAWLREEVPTEVIEWLFALPKSKTKPAWS